MNIISPINKSIGLLESFSPTLMKAKLQQSPSLSPSSKLKISTQHKEEILNLEPINNSNISSNINIHTNDGEKSNVNNNNTTPSITGSAIQNKLNFNSSPVDSQLRNSSNTFYEININEPPQIPSLSHSTSSQQVVINFNELMANNANNANNLNNEQDEESIEQARLQLENRNRILADIQEQLQRTSLFSNFTRYTIAYACFGISLVLTTVIMFIVGFLQENEKIIFAGIVTSPVGFVMINHAIHMAYRKSRRRIRYLQEQQLRLENPEPIDPSNIPSKLCEFSIDILSSPPSQKFIPIDENSTASSSSSTTSDTLNNQNSSLELSNVNSNNNNNNNNNEQDISLSPNDKCGTVIMIGASSSAMILPA